MGLGTYYLILQQLTVAQLVIKFPVTFYLTGF
jgi:hypothetical protein